MDCCGLLLGQDCSVASGTTWLQDLSRPARRPELPGVVKLLWLAGVGGRCRSEEDHSNLNRARNKHGAPAGTPPTSPQYSVLPRTLQLVHTKYIVVPSRSRQG